MRFGTDLPQLPPLAALGLAALLAVAVWWLRRWAVGSDGFEVLAAPVVALMGLGGLWVGTSWHDVQVDAARREVAERHGLLKWTIGPLGQRLRFDQIESVRVRRTTEKGTETTGIGTDQRSRTRYDVVYILELHRPPLVVATADRTLSAPQPALALPMPKGSTLDEIEAQALALARLGGWPAHREGYVRRGGDARPAEVGSLSALVP